MRQQLALGRRNPPGFVVVASPQRLQGITSLRHPQRLGDLRNYQLRFVSGLAVRPYSRLLKLMEKPRKSSCGAVLEVMHQDDALAALFQLTRHRLNHFVWLVHLEVA